MTNCEWFSSKLEAYFSDALSDEQLRRCQQHLANCADCRRQIDSLTGLDAGVRQVFERRLRIAQHVARIDARPRVLRMALAGSGLAVAATLLVLGLTFFRSPVGPQAIPQSPVATQTPSESVKDKVTGSADIQRAKPENGPPAETASQPNLDAATADGPEFAITDAAGYTETLENYRGRVLLFAVLSSEQKTAVANLQQVYDAFGSNPAVRILAVSSHRSDDLPGATFPKFYNHGSKLLGVQEGQFRLIDAEGKSRLEGALSDAGSVARIRSQLVQLGIR